MDRDTGYNNSQRAGNNGREIIVPVIDEKEERPPCPKCGSSYIWSHGIGWICVDCGRQFLKRLNPIIIDYSKRPPCPDCGSQKVIKKGTNRWLCKDCGRWFPEKYRNKEREKRYGKMA